MILIGQYDSPFVRRVGIALSLYRTPFEHRPWSITGDAEKLAAFNPLLRVPTLVLENGDVLIECLAILDHLERLVRPVERLFPHEEPVRRRHLKIAALAGGLSDMAVSLFYEQTLHPAPAEFLVRRRQGQIAATLAALEALRADEPAPYWFGSRPGHADIAVAAALRHLGDAHPGLAAGKAHPALAAHCARCEALPVFHAISQPFIAPT